MAEVRADVLNAAGNILLRDGMAEFTIERVAAEARASKTTIYKTWPSKGALAFDGYFHQTQPTLEFPDTGDIAADLLTQLHAFVHLTTATPAGRIISELIGHAQTDPDLAAAMHARFSGPRLRMALDALNRAQERGQISPTVDPEAVVDQLWGACYHRLLVTGLPVTNAFVEKLVVNLLSGIRPLPSRKDEVTRRASGSSTNRSPRTRR
ncbi:MAG TPA: TetR/AcrR family transcriptional regulator C-terminal ligand-binding domain-containing protein [Solirubrobacteraceae bacterium]|nr:TetR/AcrR family transcriptional regulator C-terminal ligand-binding domain-containing protein [Solirubrobacteraceae bacterium]